MVNAGVVGQFDGFGENCQETSPSNLFPWHNSPTLTRVSNDIFPRVQFKMGVSSDDSLKATKPWPVRNQL